MTVAAFLIRLVIVVVVAFVVIIIVAALADLIAPELLRNILDA